MNIPLFQVDAFTSERFSGNPAAVCILDAWLEDPVLQAIAEENNLSETAFLVPKGEEFELRWFTPVAEVALCGHATLASALVVFDYLDWPAEKITFHTRESGPLHVTRRNGLLEMNFPAIASHPTPVPQGLEDALGCELNETYLAGEDPVTGSAHCVLIPYWSRLLNKSDLHARQVSRRGGELFCQNLGDRVQIAGDAILYLRGEITV
jgi:predicted PhzF superfamily epimerase YddE/YHI9